MPYAINYCYNCDGGSIERDAAREAVLKADPTAEIAVNARDAYPIRLEIVAPNGEVLWENDQKRLFRKRPQQQQTSRQEITNAVLNYLTAHKS